jgi:hypothetical protein
MSLSWGKPPLTRCDGWLVGLLLVLLVVAMMLGEPR